MDKQANLNERNGVAGAATQGLAWDVGSLANDAVTLTELQTQLLAADVREYGRRVWFPSMILLAGLALGWAFFPIALVTIALGLVHYWAMSYLLAFLLVSVLAAIGSALLCIIGYKMVRGRAAVLSRSRNELLHNLRWIKRVLTRTRFT
jgi:hypothetical protein